ncbi:MAG: hypothetical protein WB608_22785 [Terracidiphilus sp.]
MLAAKAVSNAALKGKSRECDPLSDANRVLRIPGFSGAQRDLGKMGCCAANFLSVRNTLQLWGPVALPFGSKSAPNLTKNRPNGPRIFPAVDADDIFFFKSPLTSNSRQISPCGIYAVLPAAGNNHR